METVDIVISPSVYGISIDLTKIFPAPRETTYLKISFIAISPRACICVEQGDGVNTAFPPMRGGGYDQCMVSCSEFFHSTPSYRTSYGDILFPLNYETKGLYTMRAQASMDSTLVEAFKLVWIATNSCDLPNVTFTDPQLANHKNIRNIFSTDW